MISVQTFMKVADALVPMAEYRGPVHDRYYIEGAIEISIDDVAVVPRAYEDYVDQLWAYLARGLVEVAAGRAFTTYYPDMPVEITMQPDGELVALRVGAGKQWREATANRRQLIEAVSRAGIAFFQALTPHVPDNAESNRIAVDELEAAARMASE
jgi:hypothetical protein